MKKKRVLWVNPSFLDYRIPLYKEMHSLCGGEFYLVYGRERIPDRCHRAVVEALGDHAIPLKEDRYDFGRRTEFANSGVSIPIPHGLYKAISDVRPDAVIAEGFFKYTPWAAHYATLHRIPLLIAYERTKHTERHCQLWRRLYRRLVNLFANGYVANGKLTKEYLMSLGVKEENIFTGGMCADSDGLAQRVASLPEEKLAEIRSNLFGTDCPRGISYVYVGQMIPRKGVGYLLDGFQAHLRNHPDDRLVLVGDGQDLPGLKKRYGNDPRILFVGGIDYSQIYKYYAACDVFVIATLEDNWSLVVPEAMACGLPVACSIYNGCHPELVHEGENGAVFDPLDLGSVVRALGYFHQVDLTKQGQRSKEIEHGFNPETTARNVMRAVDCYLGKSK